MAFIIMSDYTQNFNNTHVTVVKPPINTMKNASISKTKVGSPNMEFAPILKDRLHQVAYPAQHQMGGGIHHSKSNSAASTLNIHPSESKVLPSTSGRVSPTAQFSQPVFAANIQSPFPNNKLQGIAAGPVSGHSSLAVSKQPTVVNNPSFDPIRSPSQYLTSQQSHSPITTAAAAVVYPQPVVAPSSGTTYFSPQINNIQHSRQQQHSQNPLARSVVVLPTVSKQQQLESSNGNGAGGDYVLWPTNKIDFAALLKQKRSIRTINNNCVLNADKNQPHVENSSILLHKHQLPLFQAQKHNQSIYTKPFSFVSQSHNAASLQKLLADGSIGHRAAAPIDYIKIQKQILPNAVGQGDGPEVEQSTLLTKSISPTNPQKAKYQHKQVLPPVYTPVPRYSLLPMQQSYSFVRPESVAKLQQDFIEYEKSSGIQYAHANYCGETSCNGEDAVDGGGGVLNKEQQRIGKQQMKNRYQGEVDPKETELTFSQQYDIKHLKSPKLNQQYAKPPTASIPTTNYQQARQQLKRAENENIDDHGNSQTIGTHGPKQLEIEETFPMHQKKTPNKRVSATVIKHQHSQTTTTTTTTIVQLGDNPLSHKQQQQQQQSHAPYEPNYSPSQQHHSQPIYFKNKHREQVHSPPPMQHAVHPPPGNNNIESRQELINEEDLPLMKMFLNGEKGLQQFRKKNYEHFPNAAQLRTIQIIQPNPVAGINADRKKQSIFSQQNQQQQSQINSQQVSPRNRPLLFGANSSSHQLIQPSFTLNDQNVPAILSGYSQSIIGAGPANACSQLTMKDVYIKPKILLKSIVASRSPSPQHQSYYSPQIIHIQAKNNNIISQTPEPTLGIFPTKQTFTFQNIHQPQSNFAIGAYQQPILDHSQLLFLQQQIQANNQRLSNGQAATHHGNQYFPYGGGGDDVAQQNYIQHHLEEHDNNMDDRFEEMHLEDHDSGSMVAMHSKPQEYYSIHKEQAPIMDGQNNLVNQTKQHSNKANETSAISDRTLQLNSSIGIVSKPPPPPPQPAAKSKHFKFDDAKQQQEANSPQSPFQSSILPIESPPPPKRLSIVKNQQSPGWKARDSRKHQESELQFQSINHRIDEKAAQEEEDQQSNVPQPPLEEENKGSLIKNGNLKGEGEPVLKEQTESELRDGTEQKNAGKLQRESFQEGSDRGRRKSSQAGAKSQEGDKQESRRMSAYDPKQYFNSTTPSDNGNKNAMADSNHPKRISLKNKTDKSKSMEKAPSKEKEENGKVKLYIKTDSGEEGILDSEIMISEVKSHQEVGSQLDYQKLMDKIEEYVEQGGDLNNLQSEIKLMMLQKQNQKYHQNARPLSKFNLKAQSEKKQVEGSDKPIQSHDSTFTNNLPEVALNNNNNRDSNDNSVSHIPPPRKVLNDNGINNEGEVEGKKQSHLSVDSAGYAGIGGSRNSAQQMKHSMITRQSLGARSQDGCGSDQGENAINVQLDQKRKTSTIDAGRMSQSHKIDIAKKDAESHSSGSHHYRAVPAHNHNRVSVIQAHGPPINPNLPKFSATKVYKQRRGSEMVIIQGLVRDYKKQHKPLKKVTEPMHHPFGAGSVNSITGSMNTTLNNPQAIIQVQPLSMVSSQQQHKNSIIVGNQIQQKILTSQLVSKDLSERTQTDQVHSSKVYQKDESASIANLHHASDLPIKLGKGDCRIRITTQDGSESGGGAQKFPSKMSLNMTGKSRDNLLNKSHHQSQVVGQQQLPRVSGDGKFEEMLLEANGASANPSPAVKPPEDKVNMSSDKDKSSLMKSMVEVPLPPHGQRRYMDFLKIDEDQQQGPTELKKKASFKKMIKHLNIKNKKK